jgi:RimJ/RimL family protein N-acetyltransferase
VTGGQRRGSKTLIESRLTDRELMDVEIDALFTHDAAGRIIADNEPDGDPAPRLFLGRTREGNSWRVRHDVPEPITRELETLAAAEPVHDDLEAWPVHLDAMIEVLLLGHKPVVPERDLAYRFPAEIPGPAGATRITRANLQLLRRIVADLADVEAGLAHGDICTAMVVEGAAVSMCSCARLTDHAAEAGVETQEDYRGRGYAAVVVAAWAQAVRETGRIPFYSTSWDNAASQAVARKLGLVRYAVGLGLE